MVDILVPTHRNFITRQGYGVAAPLLSPELQGRVVVMGRPQQYSDMSQVFGGRAAKPRQEVVVTGPDGRTPIMICGLGVTEVAEMEDAAHEAYERGQKRLKEQGSVVPFAEYRERRGLPDRTKFDELYRQALADKVADQKRNWRSNPAPDPMKRYTKGTAQVAMPLAVPRAVPHNPLKEG